MSRPVHPRLPCLVGTARRTWRDGDAPEPLDMWVEVAREAAKDVGVRDLLRAVDGVDVVHCMSWTYDDAPGRLAARLGLQGVRTGTSILAGTAPQRLLDEAALRILQGSSEVEVVVGGEALATRERHVANGSLPPWSFPAGVQLDLPLDVEQWYLPTELAHGVVPAYVTFALLEQARWADRGGRTDDRTQLAEVMDRLNRRATEVTEAWHGERHTGAELVRPGQGNRLVAHPYTVRTTAMLQVDMAAANVLASHEQADRWGVPPEQRLYLRGWGFARDAVHLAARRDLGASAAMSTATTQALHMAGLSLSDVDTFDLYSCFGSAVQFAQDALGLDAADPRPLTVTGGLPYYGGPGSNYMSHSISHLAAEARAGRCATGLVTGVGMHMTKHVAGVWSVDPGPIAVPLTDGPQCHVSDADVPTTVVSTANGPVRLRAATSVRPTADADPFVLAVCETDDGRRCYARTSSPDAVLLVERDEWTGLPAKVRADGAVNELLV